ncbi:MAG: FAD-dependent oxidoreductase [Geminicoccaceae bacterium]
MPGAASGAAWVPASTARSRSTAGSASAPASPRSPAARWCARPCRPARHWTRSLPAPPPEGASLPERHCDILVIGAGPAGLAAALAARRLGASVLVLDERAASGGQYYKQPATPGAVPVDRQGRDGAALIRPPSRPVSRSSRTPRSGAPLLPMTCSLVAGRAVRFRPQRLILATGA